MKSDRNKGKEGTQPLSLADATTIYDSLSDQIGTEEGKLFKNVDDFSEFFSSATVEQLQKIAGNLSADATTFKGYFTTLKAVVADITDEADKKAAKAGLLYIMCDAGLTGRVARIAAPISVPKKR